MTGLRRRMPEELRLRRIARGQKRQRRPSTARRTGGALLESSQLDISTRVALRQIVLHAPRLLLQLGGGAGIDLE